VVTRGDAAVLFEFTEEILDQVARLVERLIELAGRCSVLPRRDHGGFPGTRQRFENTLIGIIGLVGDQHLGGHLRQQGVGAESQRRQLEAAPLHIANPARALDRDTPRL